MKNYAYIILTAIALAAFAASPALADSSVKADMASKLIGAQATSTGGEYLGTVNDVIIGSGGVPSYLVVSKTDQARFAALPFEVVNPQLKSNGEVVLAISRDQFDTVPTYSSNDLKNLSKENDMARGYRSADAMGDSFFQNINGISSANPYTF